MASDASSANYAGDLLPQDAWTLLERHPNAQLIDVRTRPEWAFVGLPDLAGLGRAPVCIEWQIFPSMEVNPSFVEDVARATQAAKDTPLLFLCRSGARSRSAAIALTRAGFTSAHNIVGGFEGDLDTARHRGTENGWKAANLPWKQT